MAFRLYDETSEESESEEEEFVLWVFSSDSEGENDNENWNPFSFKYPVVPPENLDWIPIKDLSKDFSRSRVSLKNFIHSKKNRDKREKRRLRVLKIVRNILYKR
jgi:hypothetical protein